MPTAVKCVFIFRDSTGTGWEEIHYWNSPSESPALGSRLAHLVDVIAPIRALLLGVDCAVIGCRVSYDRPGAVASLSKKVFLQGNLSQSSVSASVSLTCKFTDASNTRHKKTYLRGIWDSVEINGEYHPENPDATGFEAYLNEWKGLLIAGGYGWPTKDIANSKEGIVVSYSSSADGIVTFTTTGADFGGATVGKNIEVAFSKLNKSNSPLNTTLLVNVATANTLITVNQIASGPFLSKGRFNYRATEFVGYSQLYDIAIGRRQQGRPIGQLPGRRKAQARW